ncbi:MAG: ABC transporter substrate-binding protein [Deltaproteobacteria bacterium]|nr:ABC transporter substrate-binding protein [Deltaproteobacteria bacterium]MBI2179651.1 ABC transporter substrate-binding protein [Deltaproteobacteria bacterium]MBI2531580.1 ABC transporter substrate-binding protein [Deltaproteobacteria bacterium]
MNLRKPTKWLLLFVFFLGVAFARLAHDAAAAEKIKFALPGNSMGYLPLFVAVHRGFFKDEGIDIELPRLVPAMAQNALMAGEVQYHGLADSGLRLAARGAPIKAIFYGADRPMYYLVGQKEVRSVAELKGKKVGVSQFGGTSDLSARLALKHFGVEPERDALIIQIGVEGTRIAALRAASVEAIIVPVPAVVLLKRDGFNVISFLGDVVEFASNGYSTTDQRIKEHPEEVKKVLRAMYRGLRFSKENPEETIKIIEREWKVEPVVARESYQAIIPALNDDGIIGEKQLKVHFDIIRRTEKNIGEIPVEKVIDFRLLREVRRELSGK